MFGPDIEICLACGGAVRIMACIEDPMEIQKIVTHLDAKAADSDVRRLRPCRAPPSAGCSTGRFDKDFPGTTTPAAQPRWWLVRWTARGEKRAAAPVGGVGPGTGTTLRG